MVGVSTLLVLAFGLPTAALPAAAAASLTPDTPIWGNVPQALYQQHMKPTGPLPFGKTLQIMIGLRAQDTQQMQSAAAQTALGLHSAVTAAGFGATYGTSQSTIQEITSYLSGYGIQVTRIWPDNLEIEAQGTAAELEQAFAVQIEQFTLKGRTVFSNTSEPRLPSAFASSVLTIGGLSNLGLAQPMSLRARSGKNQRSQDLTNYFRDLVPTQIRAAYDLGPALANGDDGTGQSIGILALSPPVNGNLSDIGVWDAQWGLNPGNVTLIGSSDYPGGADETNVDIEWASAMAPGAQIGVYQYNNDTTFDLEDDLQSMISAPQHPNVISVSWGLWEDLIDPSEIAFGDQLWAQAAAEGITSVVASADYGSYDPYTGAVAADWPASDPFVTAAGGSNATLSPQGSISSEIGWGDCIYSSESGGACGVAPDSFFLGSGGGYSEELPAPTWQQSSLPAGETMRGVPDFALNAVGYEIYASDYGGWSDTWLGTSFVAPIMSGIIADADTARGSAIGYLNPTLYALASGKLGLPNPFHAITSGSNGAYSAGPGWNPVTGLGSFDAWTLIQDLGKVATSGTHGVSFLYPSSGGAGTIVTVDGSGFGSGGTLSVAGTPIDASSDPNFSWSPNQITFTFPTTVTTPGPVTIGVTPTDGSTYAATFTATDELAISPGEPVQVSPLSGSPILQQVTVTLEGPSGQTLTGSTDEVALQTFGLGPLFGAVAIYSDANGQSDITSDPVLQLNGGQATFYVSDQVAESLEYMATDASQATAASATVYGEFDPSAPTQLVSEYYPTVEQGTYADTYGLLFDANGNLATNVQGSVYYAVYGSATILPSGQTAAEPLNQGVSDAQIGDSVAETTPVLLSFGGLNASLQMAFSPVAKIAAQVENTTAPADGTFSVQATLEDSQGNTVSSGIGSSDDLTASLCDAQGDCSPVDGTAQNGLASFDVPTTGLAGPATIVVLDDDIYNPGPQGDVQSSPVSVTVTPDPAQTLAVSTPWIATTSPGGTNLPKSAYQMIQAESLDDYGNPAPDNATAYLSLFQATGQVEVYEMQGGQLQPVAPDSLGDYEASLGATGVATFYVTDTHPDTLNYDVTTSDETLASSAIQVQGTFTALTAAQLGIKVAGPSATGGYQPVQVAVQDADGNSVFTSNDTLALKVSGMNSPTVTVYQQAASGYQPLSVDAQGLYELQASQGGAIFYVKDMAAETLSYAAQDLTTPNITPASGSGTFTAAAPTTMSLSVTPQTVATGGTAVISGTVLDQSNDPIPGLTVTFEASAGQLAQATVLTDQNGQFSLDWTAPSATGTVSFTAQAGSITSNATAQVVSGSPSQSLPLEITGFSILDSGHNPLPAGTNLTQGQQYYLQMTVQNLSSQSYVPLFLIEATMNGQVLSLGSVQTGINAGGTATVTVSFTPQVTGTINLVNLVWSNWLNLGGIPLGARLAQSAVVQP